MKDRFSLIRNTNTKQKDSNNNYSELKEKPSFLYSKEIKAPSSDAMFNQITAKKHNSIIDEGKNLLLNQFSQNKPRKYDEYRHEKANYSMLDNGLSKSKLDYKDNYNNNYSNQFNQFNQFNQYNNISDKKSGLNNTIYNNNHNLSIIKNKQQPVTSIIDNKDDINQKMLLNASETKHIKSKTEENFDQYTKINLEKLSINSLKKLTSVLKIDEMEIDIIQNLGIYNNKSIAKYQNEKSDYLCFMSYNYPESIVNSLSTDQNKNSSNSAVDSYSTSSIGFLPYLDWVYFIKDNNLVFWNYTNSNFSYLKLDYFDSPIIDIALSLTQEEAFTIHENIKYVLLVLTQKTLYFFSVIEEDSNKRSNGSITNNEQKAKDSSRNNYLDGYFISLTNYSLNVSDLVCSTIQVSSENRIFVGCSNNYVFEVTYKIESSKYFGNINYSVKKHDIYKVNFLIDLFSTFFYFKKNYVCKKIQIDETRHLMYCLMHKVESSDDILNINNVSSSKVLVYDLGNDGKAPAKMIMEIDQKLINEYLINFYKNTSDFIDVVNNPTNLVFQDILVIKRNESTNLSLILVTRCGFRLLVEFNFQEIPFYVELEEWFLLNKKNFLCYRKPCPIEDYEYNMNNTCSDNVETQIDGIFGRIIGYWKAMPVILSIKEPFLESELSKFNISSVKNENDNDCFFYFDRKLFLFSKESFKKKAKLLVYEPNINFKNERVMIDLDKNHNQQIQQLQNNQGFNPSNTNNSNANNFNVINNNNIVNANTNNNLHLNYFRVYKNNYLLNQNECYSNNFYSPLTESVKELLSCDYSSDIFEMFKFKPKSIISEWKETGHLLSRFEFSYTGKNNSYRRKSNFILNDLKDKSILNNTSSALNSELSSVNCFPGTYNTQYFFIGEEIMLFSNDKIYFIQQQRPLDCLFDIIKRILSIAHNLRSSSDDISIIVSNLIKRMIINSNSQKSDNNGYNLKNSILKSNIRDTTSYINIQDNYYSSVYNESERKSNLINADNNTDINSSLKEIYESISEFIKLHGICETSYMLSCITFSSTEYYFFSFKETNDNKSFNKHRFSNNKSKDLISSFYTINKEYNSKDTMEISYQLLVNLSNLVFNEISINNNDFIMNNNQDTFNNNNKNPFSSNLIKNNNNNNINNNSNLNRNNFTNEESKKDTFVPIDNYYNLDSNYQSNYNSINYISYAFFNYISRLIRFCLEDNIFQPTEIEDINKINKNKEQNEANNKSISNIDNYDLLLNKKDRPKILKSFNTTLNQTEIQSFIRLLLEFKTALFDKKERLISDLTAKSSHSNNSASLDNDLCLLNLRYLREEIDELFFLINQTLESFSLVSIINDSEELKQRFTYQSSVTQQNNLLRITFKNLIYRKENLTNVKFLLDEYFQALIFNSNNWKDFSFKVGHVYSQCPSFFSKADIEIIYAYYILNENKLMRVSDKAINYSGVNNNNKDSKFIDNIKKENFLNLSAINNDDEADFTEETETLKNSINVICNNPLSMKFDVILQALSRLKAVRYIVKICVCKAKAINEILDRQINKRLFTSESLNQETSDYLNYHVEHSLFNNVNPVNTVVSYNDYVYNNDNINNLSTQDLECLKQQMKYSVTVLIKLLEEIDFRVNNFNIKSKSAGRKLTLEEMNKHLFQSSTFPASITPLFTSFTLNKRQSQEQIDNQEKITVSKEQMTEILIQWKKIIMEEILRAYSPQIHSMLFYYLHKENQFIDILSIESEYLEKYLTDKFSTASTIENTYYLYKYYFTAKKDLNLSLNYLIHLVFSNNDDIINLNSTKKINLEERKGYCQQALLLLDKMNSSSDFNNQNNISNSNNQIIQDNQNKEIISKYLAFKPSIQTTLDCLNLQKELIIYLKKLLSINNQDDSKQIIEEDVYCLEYKVYPLDKIISTCSTYQAFSCAIKSIHYLDKTTISDYNEIIRNLHIQYLRTLEKNTSNFSNLQESLIFYMNNVFDYKYISKYGVKNIDDIISSGDNKPEQFNINSTSEMNIELNEDLTYLLKSVFPIFLIIEEIERINSNSYPIDRHSFESTNKKERNDTLTNNTTTTKYHYNSLKQMLDLDYKSNFSAFWFISYLIDFLKIKPFVLFNIYYSIMLQVSKCYLPHLQLVVFFIVNRMIKEVNEYLKYYDLNGNHLKSYNYTTEKAEYLKLLKEEFNSFVREKEAIRMFFKEVSLKVNEDYISIYYTENKSELLGFMNYIENCFEKTVNELLNRNDVSTTRRTTAFINKNEYDAFNNININKSNASLNTNGRRTLGNPNTLTIDSRIKKDYISNDIDVQNFGKNEDKNSNSFIQGNKNNTTQESTRMFSLDNLLKRDKAIKIENSSVNSFAYPNLNSKTRDNNRINEVNEINQTSYSKNDSNDINEELKDTFEDVGNTNRESRTNKRDPFSELNDN